MFRIGEFSRISQVSVKALRHYDAIGLLHPIHVDPDSCYRYYSIEQVAPLHRIVALKDLGLSLEAICYLLARDVSAEVVQRTLRQQREEIERRIGEDQARLRRIEARLADLADVDSAGEQQVSGGCDVLVKSCPSLWVAAVRRVLPMVREIAPFGREVAELFARRKIARIGPWLHIYHQLDFRECDLDVEVAAPVEEGTGVPCGDTGEPAISIHALPAIERAASVLHQGPYDTIAHAYYALGRWLARTGFRIAGQCREVYLRGPGAALPEGCITEIQCPVELEA